MYAFKSDDEFIKRLLLPTWHQQCEWSMHNLKITQEAENTRNLKVASHFAPASAPPISRLRNHRRAS